MKTLSFLLLLLICCDLQAGLVMTLTPASHSSARGAETVFSGTLTNTSLTDKLYLNDIIFSLSGASATQLVTGSDSFFANVPGVLLPGESYTVGEVFRIVLKPGAPFATYGGTAGIAGGADINAATVLASSSFTVLAPNPVSATTDTDGDGIPDLLEYALDLNPAGADTTSLPTMDLSSGFPELSFFPNAAAPDVAFAVEASTDLIIWSTVDVLEVTPLADLAKGRVTFRYNHPLTNTPKAFLRLKITRN